MYMADHMSGQLRSSFIGANGGLTITLKSPDGSISLAASILLDSFSNTTKFEANIFLSLRHSLYGLSRYPSSSYLPAEASSFLLAITVWGIVFREEKGTPFKRSLAQFPDRLFAHSVNQHIGTAAYQY